MGKYVGLKAMEELERGREFAIQLRQLMSFTSSSISKRQHGLVDDNVNGAGAGDCGSTTLPSAEDLVANVLASFTNTLLLLNNDSDDGRHVFSHQVEVEVEGLQYFHHDSNNNNNNVCDSSSWIPSNSDDSQHSTSKNTTSSVKDRRGRHKRRKGTNSWEQVSEISTIEDGHAWRKYGQKMILNNKFPRNYYRCTHKFDQGCQATKQVERIQDDPPLHRTTYYGHHTCTNLLNPEIILDSPHPHLSSSSFLLSFSNNDNTNSKTNNNTNIPIPNLFLSSSSSSSFPNNNPIKNDYHLLLSQHDHQLSATSTFESHHHIYNGDIVISSPVDFYDHHHDYDELDALIFDPYEL